MGAFFSALLGKFAWGRSPADQVGVNEEVYHHTDTPPEFELVVQMLGRRRTTVQVTKDSTVESAVYLALSKHDAVIELEEFRVIYRGNQVDLEKSLEALEVCPTPPPKIWIIPRLRGGGRRRTHVQLEFKSFMVRMNELSRKDEWFKQRGSEYLLCKLGRHTFHKLFEMVSLYHVRNKSLNGGFNAGNIIYIPWVDSYIIDPGVNVVDFNPDRYVKDMKALAKVLSIVRMSKLVIQGKHIYPPYVQHLLGIMENIPREATYSDTFKAFLRNHPCMMSADSRQGLVLEVHNHVKFSYHEPILNTALGRCNWLSIAERNSVFEAVFKHARSEENARGKNGHGYTGQRTSFFRFCRNLLAHQDRNKTMEQADLALWKHFKEDLAKTLCLLSYKHNFTSNVFDKDWFCAYSNVSYWPATPPSYRLEEEEEDPEHGEGYVVQHSSQQRNQNN